MGQIERFLGPERNWKLFAGIRDVKEITVKVK